MSKLIRILSHVFHVEHRDGATIVAGLIGVYVVKDA
jgi:hypothetical protein